MEKRGEGVRGKEVGEGRKGKRREIYLAAFAPIFLAKDPIKSSRAGIFLLLACPSIFFLVKKQMGACLKLPYVFLIA